MNFNRIINEKKGLPFRVQKKILEGNSQKSLESDKIRRISPMPRGYKLVRKKESVIIKNVWSQSEFVWIDAKNTCSLRRTNFYCNDFSKEGYHEDESSEKLHNSIRKYGGFYISRYLISKGIESVSGEMPLTNVTYSFAVEAAKCFMYFAGDHFGSCLPSGTVYDTIIMWLIKNKIISYNELVKDSSKWANYGNAKPTGVRNLNELQDIGNCLEITTEKCGANNFVARGPIELQGDKYPVASRFPLPEKFTFGSLGFRIVLYYNP